MFYCNMNITIKYLLSILTDQISSIAKSYERNMAEIYDGILKRGMFSWQQLWNGQSNPSQKNGCCTKPLVEEGKTCATSLRAMCSADRQVPFEMHG